MTPGCCGTEDAASALDFRPFIVPFNMRAVHYGSRDLPALGRDLRVVPAFILISSVLFNAGLAVINAHVVRLSSASVIGAEVALVTAAHIVALANYKPQMKRWYALFGWVLLFAVIRAGFTGTVEFKYIRDIIVIPTFIVLGMTFDERGLTRTVVILHAIVLAVLVIEAADASAYSSLFKVQDYYINTRGFDFEDFWNKESDLFVSATRPDERFIGWVDLHRLSSVFLEPVSLGDYCTIVVAFVCARYAQLNVATRAFLIIATFAMMIGCDGRLAMVSSVLIVAVAAVSPYLPKRSAVAYLPVCLAVAFLAVYFGKLRPGSDDFAGRIAYSADLLSQFDVLDLLGLSDEHVLKAVDSGISYLIATQSLVGLIVLWVFIVYGGSEQTQSQIKYTHALCVYILLAMIVSYSILSIKTAALAWFIQGVLQGASSYAVWPAAGERVWPHRAIPRPS